MSEPGVFPSILTQPSTDDLSRPFWEASVEGRLVAPRCTNCGTFRLPPWVLTGMAPFGQRMLPSATNGPPSPIGQKP